MIADEEIVKIQEIKGLATDHLEGTFNYHKALDKESIIKKIILLCNELLKKEST